MGSGLLPRPYRKSDAAIFKRTGSVREITLLGRGRDAGELSKDNEKRWGRNGSKEGGGG